MISDRFTAKVLGLGLVLFTLLIDLSFLMFAKPELRQRPGFFVLVIVPSLPFILGGIHLLRRAERMKEDESD